MIILTLIKGLRKFQDGLNEGDNNIVNKNKIVSCGGAKTQALALGLSPTFYQQYVRGEEIMGEPHN